jgi:hypothetical protein
MTNPKLQEILNPTLEFMELQGLFTNKTEREKESFIIMLKVMVNRAYFLGFREDEIIPMEIQSKIN